MHSTNWILLIGSALLIIIGINIGSKALPIFSFLSGVILIINVAVLIKNLREEKELNKLSEKKEKEE
jgi:hypothetical protein